MSYGKSHKIFLQTLLQSGVFEEQRAKDLIVELFGDETKIEQTVREINAQLRTLDMEIKSGRCEITGRLYWALSSSVMRDVARFQTEFSRAKAALLRHVYSIIVHSDNECAHSVSFLNLCARLDSKLPKADAEDFLDEMVSRHWLFYRAGCYYMGVRSVIEMLPYFRATYKDVLNYCAYCKEIIFYSKKCEYCKSMMHLHCLKNYAKFCDPPKCPDCDNPVLLDASDLELGMDL
ncbi:hypothetical protein KM043_000990 [Ampulex compressa]|nr:hypothetical protein KM043_000990 [Ampulex compressa]